MAVKKKKQKIKVIKKEWYQVKAPKQFGNAIVGEIAASDPEKIIGRRVDLPLSELTRNVRLHGIHVKLKIHDVSSKKAITTVEDYEILPSMLKRYVRRNRTRLDDSFVIQTKDEINVRIKPIVVTAFQSKGDVNKNLKKTMRELIAKRTANSSYDDFVSDVINHKLQTDIIKKLTKVYPVKYFEIRRFVITKAKPTKIEVKETKKEEVENESSSN